MNKGRGVQLIDPRIFYENQIRVRREIPSSLVAMGTNVIWEMMMKKVPAMKCTHSKSHNLKEIRESWGISSLPRMYGD